MHDPSLADLHAAERLLGSGDVAAALRLASAALAGSAPHPAWHRLQGLALVASGRAVDARPHLQRYVAVQPGEPEAWINLGNACIEAGDAKEALRAFEGAREAGASGVPYLLGRGLALLAAGCFGEALGWLRRARAEEPDAADVRLALGQCFTELERFDELRECIAGIDPETLPHGQRRAFAWLTALSGQDDAALALYRRLMLEEPAEPETRVRFALLLERMNRVQDAADLLSAGGAGGTGAGSMEVLARARIARRQHHPASFADALATAAAGEPDPAMAAQLWFELAKCRDQLQDPRAAMQALSHAHGHAAAAFRQRHPGLEAEQVLAWLGERLHGALPPPHPPLASDPPDPVFLVGFPRSGTTLLEQMLDRHPALQVLDERPAMEHVIAGMHALPGWSGDDLDGSLAGLDTAQCRRLRAKYRVEVARHLRPAGRLVDKYPLYLTRVAHIQRLFPASAWVLLLRHPCDCVLSCHFQAFGLNGGALAFASLESTARTYAAVMDYWEQQRLLAKPNVHVVHYEDLVADPEAVLGRLMGSLGLAFEAEQLAFPAAVAARTRRINTPSYAQVAETVNRNAVGRWRRYRAHFSTRVLDRLAPCVERYGYTLD